MAKYVLSSTGNVIKLGNFSSNNYIFGTDI